MERNFANIDVQTPEIRVLQVVFQNQLMFLSQSRFSLSSDLDGDSEATIGKKNGGGVYLGFAFCNLN